MSRPGPRCCSKRPTRRSGSPPSPPPRRVELEACWIGCQLFYWPGEALWLPFPSLHANSGRHGRTSRACARPRDFRDLSGRTRALLRKHRP
jgi:hypothetical protein